LVALLRFLAVPAFFAAEPFGDIGFAQALLDQCRNADQNFAG
jgi:hypothetical protein